MSIYGDYKNFILYADNACTYVQKPQEELEALYKQALDNPDGAETLFAGAMTRIEAELEAHYEFNCLETAGNMLIFPMQQMFYALDYVENPFIQLALYVASIIPAFLSLIGAAFKKIGEVENPQSALRLELLTHAYALSDLPRNLLGRPFGGLGEAMSIAQELNSGVDTAKAELITFYEDDLLKKHRISRERLAEIHRTKTCSPYENLFIDSINLFKQSLEKFEKLLDDENVHVSREEAMLREEGVLRNVIETGRREGAVSLETQEKAELFIAQNKKLLTYETEHERLTKAIMVVIARMPVVRRSA
ncbi:MAG: hypothetical protein HYX48_04795 [Chlamydiales bacterium]|nr:hypothetical protein [Chlamydiales bacterium]